MRQCETHLTTTDKVHYLDSVLIPEDSLVPVSAAYYFAIEFYRNSLNRKFEQM
jgi:hypothetical protein